MLYIQLIGILAFCVLVLSFYKKKTATIIMYQIVSSFAYTIHYFLLGAISGAFVNFIGIFRNFGYLKVKKHKKIFAAVIIFLYLIVTIIFYEDIFSFLPFVANSQYLLAMLKDNKKTLLISAVICSSMWGIYAIFASSYSAMITETILVISNTIQIIKLIKKSR